MYRWDIDECVEKNIVSKGGDQDFNSNLGLD